MNLEYGIWLGVLQLWLLVKNLLQSKDSVKVASDQEASKVKNLYEKYAKSAVNTEDAFNPVASVMDQEWFIPAFQIISDATLKQARSKNGRVFST